MTLFNHKGGVSKTTTTFNLGWMLAEKGHRTLIVDADSQCNLTGMVLGYQGPTELERFYRAESERNIYAGLAPAFESRPVPIAPVDCFPVQGTENLFLLPGHVGISEYEVTLGIAQELSGSIQTLQNLPGSIHHLIKLTADAIDAEYVLIDMSPGLGAVNQNLLATSDYFLVPASPDFFSLMAMDSLARVLPKWQRWAESAYDLEILRNAAYPFPRPHTRFIGTVIQKYRPRNGEPASAFQAWIERIGEAVKDNLAPALRRSKMLLPLKTYRSAHVPADYCLAQIPDFNSLIAKSQQYQVPIFALTDQQIGQHGRVLSNTRTSRDLFRETFSSLADDFLTLTSGGN